MGASKTASHSSSRNRFRIGCAEWIGTAGTARDILMQRYRMSCNRLVFWPRLQKLFSLPQIEIF